MCEIAVDRKQSQVSKLRIRRGDARRGSEASDCSVFQLSTRLYIVHLSPYPDVGVEHPLRYPWWSNGGLLYLDVSARRYLNIN